MSGGGLETRGFEVARGQSLIAGEEQGSGPPVIALHGLTATRRYVVHGSRALPRAGYRLITYDARGHGESGPQAPERAYSYEGLAADLAAVIDDRAPGTGALLVGHSMGAHTLARHALARPQAVAGIVVVGPGVVGDPAEAETLERWERLAAGLESGGVDGFIAALDTGLDPAWRERVLEITRLRLERHRRPEEVVRALREVPRSLPFDGLGELERLDVPALVVASHDTADPGHPYAVAEAWAERLPRARLISEAQGESPLAWQGGKLSREIAAFAGQPEVAERLAA